MTFTMNAHNYTELLIHTFIHWYEIENFRIKEELAVNLFYSLPF